MPQSAVCHCEDSGLLSGSPRHLFGYKEEEEEAGDANENCGFVTCKVNFTVSI